jgi:hypothetical protein
MENLGLNDLKKIARELGIGGFSTMRKQELIDTLISYKIVSSRASPSPKRASPKRASPKMASPEFVDSIKVFLKPGFRFDEESKHYINELFRRLAYNIDNEDFTESIGYMGQEAEQRAVGRQYTNIIIPGTSDLFASNFLMYIANELIDLVNYALIDSKKTVVTVPILRKVIENDYELSAALLGIPIPV